MNEYFNTDFLMGDNQYQCMGCGTHRDAKKRFSIEKSPRVLIVQLKRTDKNRRKIKTQLEFPSTFSLTNFKSKSIDRIASGLPALPLQMNSDMDIYDLTGFVVHQGETPNKGHYYSVVKGRDGLWIRCNDAKITPLPEGYAEDASQAYILFYQKRVCTSEKESLDLIDEDLPLLDAIVLQRYPSTMPSAKIESPLPTTEPRCIMSAPTKVPSKSISTMPPPPSANPKKRKLADF